MPRFTPSTALACALVAVLVAGLTGCVPGPAQTVFSGNFSPDEPIRLTNKTITGGKYLVGYSLDVLVSSNDQPVNFICSMVDTSGQFSVLEGMARSVTAGKWISLDVENVFELSDLTLGIRCAPVPGAALTVVFRDVKLSAKKIS